MFPWQVTDGWTQEQQLVEVFLRYLMMALRRGGEENEKRFFSYWREAENYRRDLELLLEDA